MELETPLQRIRSPRPTRLRNLLEPPGGGGPGAGCLHPHAAPRASTIRTRGSRRNPLGECADRRPSIPRRSISSPDRVGGNWLRLFGRSIARGRCNRFGEILSRAQRRFFPEAERQDRTPRENQPIVHLADALIARSKPNSKRPGHLGARRAGLPAASPQGRPRGPVERSRLGQPARGIPLRGRRGRGRGPDRLPLTEWEQKE